MHRRRVTMTGRTSEEGRLKRQLEDGLSCQPNLVDVASPVLVTGVGRPQPRPVGFVRHQGGASRDVERVFVYWPRVSVQGVPAIPQQVPAFRRWRDEGVEPAAYKLRRNWMQARRPVLACGSEKGERHA